MTKAGITASTPMWGRMPQTGARMTPATAAIIVPSTTPKMAGATGNPFSSKMNDTTPKNKISVTPQTELLIEKEPTIQNIKIIGIKILRFTRKILVANLTVSHPSGTMMMLAKIKTKKMA